MASPLHISCLNILIRFLARRDVPTLSKERLQSKFNIPQTDLLILLGNSSLYVASQAAEAYKKGLSKELMICGGIGHSTKYLAENVKKHPQYRNIETENRPEAEILKDIFIQHCNIPQEKILMENQSTNCGANAMEALKVLNQYNIHPQSILLLQDPVLQLRSLASFQKTWQGRNIQFISYACFIPEVKLEKDIITYTNTAHQEFCDMERFLSLVMGEIPRLRNDKKGYGPKGKNFISEVNIPQEVNEAYKELEKVFKEFIRP
ncbi:MAG: YdcF family protein [Cytophagaceae bacterium]|nr:YdcF family protein [Cytophagaceae bacterium]